jgi:polyphenol oxidase
MWDDPKVECAFSSRKSQNMSLSYGDTADSLKHRKDFLTGLGIDYRDLVCAKQVHASRVAVVNESDRGKGALSYDTAIDDTDALITDKKDLPLAIFTADCLSVFLFDPATPAIGLVHAGWRSSKEHIAAKALQKMEEVFGTDPASVQASFGPLIKECCYEVDKEFSGYFLDNVEIREDRYYLDLAAVNQGQLARLGVKAMNIRRLDLCTFCSKDDFFSYRREKEASGRMISVMMLK